MGVVSYDIHASARRLEAAFPLHTEIGVRDFLEKLNSLEELKYLSGDYEIAVWLLDFYKNIFTANLSEHEMMVLYYLYFEGYTQSELVKMLGKKKTTINTLLTRGVRKISYVYESIKLKEEGIGCVEEFAISG